MVDTRYNLGLVRVLKDMRLAYVFLFRCDFQVDHSMSILSGQYSVFRTIMLCKYLLHDRELRPYDTGFNT